MSDLYNDSEQSEVIDKKAYFNNDYDDEDKADCKKLCKKLQANTSKDNQGFKQAKVEHPTPSFAKVHDQQTSTSKLHFVSRVIQINIAGGRFSKFDQLCSKCQHHFSSAMDKITKKSAPKDETVQRRNKENLSPSPNYKEAINVLRSEYIENNKSAVRKTPNLKGSVIPNSKNEPNRKISPHPRGKDEPRKVSACSRSRDQKVTKEVKDIREKLFGNKKDSLTDFWNNGPLKDKPHRNKSKTPFLLMESSDLILKTEQSIGKQCDKSRGLTGIRRAELSGLLEGKNILRSYGAMEESKSRERSSKIEGVKRRATKNTGLKS